MSDSEDAASEVDVPTSIDPYEVLGLERTASEADVKKAYRKAALRNHPGTSSRSPRLELSVPGTLDR